MTTSVIARPSANFNDDEDAAAFDDAREQKPSTLRYQYQVRNAIFEMQLRPTHRFVLLAWLNRWSRTTARLGPARRHWRDGRVTR